MSDPVAAPSAKRIRRRKSVHCGHCDRMVPASTYYRHREQFFDVVSQQWQQHAEHLSAQNSSHEQEEVSRQVDDSASGHSGDEDLVSVTDRIASSSDDSSESEVQTIDEVEEIWPSSDSDIEEDSEAPAAASKPVWQLLFFLFYWQSVFKVSNAAITCLMRFCKYFFSVVGKAFQSPLLEDLSRQVPQSLKDAYACAGIVSNEFIEYVVCPSCHSVYEYKDCIQIVGRERLSRHCCHVSYPNHPQHSRRQPCGATLLKSVRSGRGHRLVPIKVFPYMPIQKSLQNLASRPGFINACEQWRDRVATVPSGYLGDIYDGRVWHNFHSATGYDFLSAPLSYLLTLNVDWFQPFLHTQYSVGAMYLTIQNLPRMELCKEENVILVGVLPGPSEPSLAMNSYLSPLVEELKQGWEKGFPITTSEGVNVNIRVALSCIACDIPASRKVSGFIGHNASLACNKCLKKFSVVFGSPMDYSGFDRETWTPRSNGLHRQHCEEILKETTKTGLRKMESKYGLRYSVLLSLPYFNPVQFTAIDTMHNLYLGTGKHAFKVWVSKNLLSNESLTEIDRMARLFNVPTGTGRLPVNISSNYGGFKADQWRTWITVYSPILLKGILPREHLQCWLLFVRACNILSQRIIKLNDLCTADLLLLNYCNRFEELYGKEHCTMNLHLHLHIKDTMLDFGPSHAFWCFPFERYNGILGSYSTNMKAVEVQFMRKFTSSQSVKALSRLADPYLCSLLQSSGQNTTSLPPSTTTCGANTTAEELLNMATLPLTHFKHVSGIVELLPPLCEIVFPSEAVHQLDCLYKQLYPNHTIIFSSPFYQRCNRVTLAGDLIGSVHNAASATSSSVVMAYWPGRGNNLSTIDYSRMRVGIVQYFFKHEVMICSADNVQQNIKLEFAYVYWKQKHPREDWFGNSATVCIDMFEPLSACNFIPVQQIARKCAYCTLNLEIIPNVKEDVFVACPVQIKCTL